MHRTPFWYYACKPRAPTERHGSHVYKVEEKGFGCGNRTAEIPAERCFKGQRNTELGLACIHFFFKVDNHVFVLLWTTFFSITLWFYECTSFSRDTARFRERYELFSWSFTLSFNSEPEERRMNDFALLAPELRALYEESSSNRNWLTPDLSRGVLGGKALLATILMEIFCSVG